MRLFDTESRGSPLSRLDPRVRVAAAGAGALLLVLLDRWTALGAAAAAVLALAAGSRAFGRAALRRLVELNLFTLFLLVFMPLSVPGTPVLRLGAWYWSAEGALAALRIGAKANLVMLLAGTLLAAMEPSDLAHALYRLRVPAKLAHALFFCIRYLDVVHEEYHRLRNAMSLRAFRPRCSRHALRSLGYLLGMLFVRSVDRSDRVLEAMKCRGFRGRLYSLAVSAPGRRDALFGAAAAAAALAVGFLEWGP